VEEEVKLTTRWSYLTVRAVDPICATGRHLFQPLEPGQICVRLKAGVD
jgi:hypothetical protein